jgi:multidrug efflux system membrane fusion protein
MDMDEQVSRHDVVGEHATSPRDTFPASVRRRRGLFWLVALLLLFAVGALAWREFAAGPAATPAPAGRNAAAGPPQPVGVATAATGDVRVVLNALGTVTPLATVTVKTQIAGQLQQIAFTEGQMVHKGDFLAQIDPRPYQAALEQDEGQLAHDQALLKQSQADLVRYQTLLRQDSIARQQAEDQTFLVQQYQGSIRSDQAQIDTQKLNLVYCHIVAPVDGRVGLRQVDQGNYVQTSDSNGIVVITQEQPISVVFTIAEDDLPAVQKQLRAGTALTVAAYDRANVTLIASGTLATTDNQIDTTTGTVKLRALFANPDEALFPNQFVNARLLVNTLHGVVTVPAAAIQRGAPGTFAYVVAADNTVSVRVLKLGVTDGDKVQVTSGLNAGDRVVIDGTDRLREGAKVSVQPARTGTADIATAPGAVGPAAATPPEAGGDEAQKRHRHQQQPPNGT